MAQSSSSKTPKMLNDLRNQGLILCENGNELVTHLLNSEKKTV